MPKSKFTFAYLYNILFFAELFLHRPDKGPRGMDYTPLPVIFLLIYLDAIIFHVDKIRFGKKLVGKHRHILADLYTRTTEVVAVRMKFALDGF